MKYMIIADLHLHNKPIWRVQWLNEFIDKVCLESKNDYDGLVLLGDAVEIKNNIDCEVSNMLFRLLGNFGCSGLGGKIFIVGGQHDTYKPSVSSFFELNNFNNKNGYKLEIVDKSSYIDPSNHFFILPYNRNLWEYRDWIKSVKNTDGCLLTHMPIVEALPFQVKGEYLCLKDFSKIKTELIISGDIHKAVAFENRFYYVGSPSQRDWRDAGAEGYYGVLHFDKDGAKFDRVETKCPLHLEVADNNEIPSDRKCIVKSVYEDAIKDTGSNVLDSHVSLEHISQGFVLQKSDEKKEMMDNYVKENSNNVNGLSNDELIVLGQSFMEGKK